MIKMENKFWEVENLLDIDSCFQEVEVKTGMDLSLWEINDLDSEGFDNVSILAGHPIIELPSLPRSYDDYDLANSWYETPEYTAPVSMESILLQYPAIPVDMDSFDIVSIRIPIDEVFKKNKVGSRNSIIEEIELAASQGIFEYNMAESPRIPNMVEDVSRSSMRLIKGNKKVNVNRLFRKLENEQPATFDIFAYNEAREFHSTAKSECAIPLRVSFEKGDMVFRLKLSSVGMGDLKSLQAIPGFSKAVAHFTHTIHASLEDEELRLVVPGFRSRRTAM
jgi:hypothetical protein